MFSQEYQIEKKSWPKEKFKLLFIYLSGYESENILNLKMVDQT